MNASQFERESGQKEQDALRARVRERYADAARSVATVAAEIPSEATAGCCGSKSSAITAEQQAVFGAGLYLDGERDSLPDKAVLASLGCGNPTAVAELRAGETVLDLGSGGGIDVLLSAKRVGPGGRAIGLDMTDEMLELARSNQAEAGVANAEFVKGTIEDVPLADESVDVVISNCVINLSADKPKVLHEAARVLRPGGRFAVSDVIADADLDPATRADVQQWTGCVAGALTADEYAGHLEAAGFTAIEIEPTHRVHAGASSAIVRATKPAPAPG